MCKSPLHPLLAALPKCEHHLHIEGTLEPALLFHLASKNSISLPSSSDPAFSSPSTLSARYARFTSLDDFLHYYFIGMTTLLTVSDFHDLAVAYFNRAHADGVKHAEIFFDPQAHLSRGVSYQTVVGGLESACKYAERELGMSTCLIPCILRHLPISSAQETFTTLLPDLQSRRLTGLGLSSTEKGYPPELFRGVFTSPAILEPEGGTGRIHTTAHAGEEGPVDYMRSAIHDLQVQRIDHGIRLLDDPELLRDFVQSRTLITICPISNLSLRAAPSISALPIRAYLDAGVRFSINSDDPAYFGVTAPYVDQGTGEEVDGVGSYILSNYCAVQEAFGFGVEEWGRIGRNAIEGSWCGEGRKGELLGLLEEYLARFRRKE